MTPAPNVLSGGMVKIADTDSSLVTAMVNLLLSMENLLVYYLTLFLRMFLLIIGCNLT
ncbi:hypothetical protein ASZ90_008824 [hydrocarbon metagenome]|uniref:Uncharacterized protein n=1 Tax=hydrocarbon metagenome TaxID=938273 RepID=A0A0W8FKT9_9ZZZZ